MKQSSRRFSPSSARRMPATVSPYVCSCYRAPRLPASWHAALPHRESGRCKEPFPRLQTVLKKIPAFRNGRNRKSGLPEEFSRSAPLSPYRIPCRNPLHYSPFRARSFFSPYIPPCPMFHTQSPFCCKTASGLCLRLFITVLIQCQAVPDHLRSSSLPL